MRPKRRCNNQERGFSLIELMVSLLILSVISLGLAQSFVTASRTIRGTERSSLQSQLALSKLEEIAAIPAADLPAGELSEDDIVIRGMKFQRVTSITPYNDGRRQVIVTVSTIGPNTLQPSVTYQGVFNPWGLR